MDKKIINCLKIIQNNRDNGVIQTESDFLENYPDYSKSNLKHYKKMGLLGKKGNCPYITPLGFKYLNARKMFENNKKLKELVERFSSSTKKTSSETLKHTKTMKKLTWFILGFTIINSILVVIQLLKITGVIK